MTTPDHPEPPESPHVSGPATGSGHPDDAGCPAEPPGNKDSAAAHDTECVWCRRRAPELALGALCGRERARMLVHLQGCGPCQDCVCELAVTAERLVGLVPEVEPPPEFEQRVLAAIAAASAPVPERPLAGGSALSRLSGSFAAAERNWAPTTSKPRTRSATRTRPEGSPPGTGAGSWAARRRGWIDRRQLIAAGACAVLLTGGVLATVVSTIPTSGPTAVISSPPMAPTADVIVAPLISETSDARLDTDTRTRTIGAGSRTGKSATPSLSGREIGEAWIHPESPSWVYVSITASPDAPADTVHPSRGDAHAGGPAHDDDEPVTCTLIPSTGATIDLGTFTVRNGRADWATPTTIDPHTLTRAQLTIEHGHTLARATFTPTQVGKDADQDKDRHKAKNDTKQDAKEDSKDGAKDEAKEDDKGNASRDDTKDSTKDSAKDSTNDPDKDSGDHKAGEGPAHDPTHTLIASPSHSGHAHNGPGDTRDGPTDHSAEHPSVGSHHGTTRHNGGHRGHTPARGGDHHGDHHQHSSGSS